MLEGTPRPLLPTPFMGWVLPQLSQPRFPSTALGYLQGWGTHSPGQQC